MKNSKGYSKATGGQGSAARIVTGSTSTLRAGKATCAPMKGSGGKR